MYGTSYKTKPVSVINAQLTLGFPVYGIPDTLEIKNFSGDWFEGKVMNFSRSGSNANGKVLGNYRQPKAVPLLKKVRVKGPRSMRLAYIKRTNTWKWIPAEFYNYRIHSGPPTKIRRVKDASRYTAPNSLHFESHRFVPFGARSVSTRNLDAYGGQLSESKYEGDLWTVFPDGFGGNVGVEGVARSTSVSSEYLSRVAELDELVVKKLYSNVKNQYVNLAQALAESNQTRNLIADAATRLAKGVLQVRKGNIAGAFKTLLPTNSKDLANDVLVFNYGVKPLLSDIEGLMEHIVKEEKIEFDVIVKRRVNIENLVLQDADVRNSNILGWRELVTSSGYVEVKRKLTLRATRNSYIGRELSRLGFGNLGTLAWEATPWSFVADWLIPIGDYLNSRDAFSDLEVIHHTKTVFVKENRVVTRTFGGKRGIWTTDEATCGFVQELIYTDRSIQTELPSLPLPSFKNPYSSAHATNAAALLRQLRK